MSRDSVTSVTCPNCRSRIYLTEAMYLALKGSHLTFYCLQGHAQHFPAGRSELDLTREKLVAAERRERDEQRLRIVAEQKLKHVRNKCSHCPKSFDTPGKLKQHTKRIHTKTLALPKNAGPSN